MEWYVKSEDVSNPEYGEYPGSRSVEELLRKGVVVIDKPSGPTSHQVTAWVRDMLGLPKAGHSGTLDPRVTGVLVITLGEATKMMPALIGLDKEYVGVMHLHKDVSPEKLEEARRRFEGEIIQKPPVKSSVKRVRRKRVIYSLEFLEREEKDVLFRVRCEAGTYIRKLCDDIGRYLGVGAHMHELRRIAAGPFTEEQAVILQDLKDAYEFWKEGDESFIREVVKPVEILSEHLGKIVVKDTAVNAICNGAPLAVGGISRVQKGIKKGDLVAILTLKGELVALARAAMDSEEMYRSRKGMAARTDRVMMERKMYPATWRSSHNL